MEGYKYVITLYMAKYRGIISVQRMINFAMDVANIYNVTYEEFGFSYTCGKKDVTKTLRYTQKNIDKIHMIDAQNITALSFDQYKKDKHFDDPEFRLDFFLPNTDDYPNRFSLIIDSAKKSLTSDVVTKVVNHLCILGFQIEYGAAFIIETRKGPNYFIMGGVSRYLTTEEKDMVSALALNIRQYKSKIWDIFWINIIKKTLFIGDILEDIVKILPDECILDEGDKYIISLPLTGDEYVCDKEKLNMYREKLREIFRRNDLTMYTGQHFPHFV